MTPERAKAPPATEWNRLLRDAGQQGRYALVQAGAVHGIWDTAERAIAEGYARFGDGPFRVRQIPASSPRKAG